MYSDVRLESEGRAPVPIFGHSLGLVAANNRWKRESAALPRYYLRCLYRLLAPCGRKSADPRLQPPPYRVVDSMMEDPVKQQQQQLTDGASGFIESRPSSFRRPMRCRAAPIRGIITWFKIRQAAQLSQALPSFIQPAHLCVLSRFEDNVITHFPFQIVSRSSTNNHLNFWFIRGRISAPQRFTWEPREAASHCSVIFGNALPCCFYYCSFASPVFLSIDSLQRGRDCSRIGTAR